MAGDYVKYQRHYGSLTTDLDAALLTVYPETVLSVRNSSYQIYIQKAALFVTAFVAATVTLVGHTSGVVYARFDVPAAPSGATVGNNLPYPDPIDFGPVGTPVQIGENIDVTTTITGFTGVLHIEAYQRLGKTIGSNDGALAQ